MNTVENNSQTTTINLEKVFKEIGEFGKFQVLNYIATNTAFIFVICSSLSYIFIAKDLDYRCKIPDCDGFEQQPNWIQNAMPSDGNKCEMFSRMYDDHSHGSELNNCSAESFNRSSIVQCNDFIFRTREVNLLNEFNLTCNENRWKLAFIGSLGNVAEGITLPLIGMLADRYGRRPILIYSVALVGVFGLAKSFAPNYLSFAILHFLGSLFGASAFAITFVLGAEIVGLSKRSAGASFITNGFSIGQILLAVVAMNVSHFRYLLRILYTLVLLALTYLWLIPESARWLYSVGAYEKAKQVIQLTAKINDSPMSDETLTSLDDYEHESKAFLETKLPVTDKRPMMSVIRSKILMLRLVNCCYCFFTNALIFYGLSVRSTDLAGDKYINLILAALVEIPGNLSTHFVLKKISRKWALTVSMIFCGVFCVSSELLSDYNATWRLVLFLLGKCTVSFSFTTVSGYVTEMFPTNCRMLLFNICKTCAAIGNIIAPQIPLLANLVPLLPMFLFGLTSITSALLVFFLPDTRHSELPQTVADAVNVGKIVA